MTRFLISLLVLLCSLHSALAQDVEISTSARVEHAKEIGDATEIDSVLRLWTNYLNSRPDTDHDSPYWSSKEKAERTYYDLAGRFLYWGVAGPLKQRMWKPHVLTIEKRGHEYEVLTIHMNADTSMPEQRIWALQKVSAIKEHGQWKLGSAINRALIRDTIRIGRFRFYLPSGLAMDTVKAMMTTRLADSLTRTFDLKPVDTIHFYIARDRDEMLSYIGVPYFMGAPTGFSISEDAMVFSSYSEPWYPHELAHVLFREFDPVIHPILSEGIATMIGGATYLDTTYEHTLSDAKARLQVGPKLSLVDAIDNPYYEGNADVHYATGAWLCKLVVDHGGVKGLHRLLGSGKTTELMREHLTEDLNLTWSQIESLWKRDFGID